jgi:hypothetical protein
MEKCGMVVGLKKCEKPAVAYFKLAYFSMDTRGNSFDHKLMAYCKECFKRFQGAELAADIKLTQEEYIVLKVMES